MPIQSAWEAFASFQQQPELFLVGIVNMVLNPTITLEVAMKVVADKLAHIENHEGAWAALDATQKALVRMIAEDTSLKPFTAKR